MELGFRTVVWAASVADPLDWKGPIAANIHADLWPLVRFAVELFTGTTPRCSLVAHNLDGRLRLDIVAVGYRAGPAGDH